MDRHWIGGAAFSSSQLNGKRTGSGGGSTAATEVGVGTTVVSGWVGTVTIGARGESVVTQRDGYVAPTFCGGPNGRRVTIANFTARANRHLPVLP
jgi:hypothetical protein